MHSNKKICVIGAGKWGANHIKILYEIGSLGGIVELKQNIQNKIKKLYPEIKIFSKVEESFEYNFSGYIIATPASSHFKIAKKVINRGHHVLIEKPMTLNSKDAEELIELSNKKNINTMVGHLLLFHPAIQKMKELIDLGKIGKLQYIYSNRLNLGQVRSEENVFWSLAPHDISIFQYITDSYPESIMANGSTFLQEGIYDSTITQLKYTNGIEGHIFVSWLHPFKEHRLVVIGSESMITFEDSIEGKPLKLYSKKYDFNKGTPEKIDGPVESIEYDQLMSLTEELRYFINHLNIKKPIISNGQHALEVTKILVEASEQLEKSE